jgi:8-oxo-dGTP pyrophosphatase MutT (NUDIX family)
MLEPVPDDAPHPMQWTTFGERPIYESPFVRLVLVDVQQPDGRRWEYHVVRLRSLAAVVMVDDAERVLLMWRHRFILDSWGWELPMGLIEPGETAEQAATREVEEETGWRPKSLRPLVYAEPANGITDSEHHVFLAEGAIQVGEPTEANESDRIEWVPLDDISAMIDRREITSSASQVGLMRYLLDRS